MEGLEQQPTLDKEMSVNDTIAELVKTLTEEKKHFDDVLKNTLSTLKNLQRDVKKMKPKKRQQTTTTDPEHKRTSGLDKPVLVSQELRDLLGLEDREYPRSDVNSRVTAYIKEHNLQNPENKREMLLDTTDVGLRLKEVLKPDQPLTFFNIQRYLKVHLIKPPEDVSLQAKNQVFVDKMVEDLNDLMDKMPKALTEDDDLPPLPDEPPPDELPKKVVKKKVFKNK
jgi:upstream activation factor subunit UAF30